MKKVISKALATALAIAMTVSIAGCVVQQNLLKHQPLQPQKLQLRR